MQTSTGAVVLQLNWWNRTVDLVDGDEDGEEKEW